MIFSGTLPLIPGVLREQSAPGIQAIEDRTIDPLGSRGNQPASQADRVVKSVRERVGGEEREREHRLYCNRTRPRCQVHTSQVCF